MAKGQQKSNREAKKPKATKKPGAAAGSANPKNKMSDTFTSLKTGK